MYISKYFFPFSSVLALNSHPRSVLQTLDMCTLAHELLTLEHSDKRLFGWCEAVALSSVCVCVCI